MVFSIIFPIGGILAIIGGILFVIVYGIQMSAADNPDLVRNFAEEYSVLIYIILAIIVVLLLFGLRFLLGKWKNAILSSFPIYLSLITTYKICIEWLIECYDFMAELFLILLITAPLTILYLLVLLALTLAPNFLIIVPYIFEKESNFFNNVYYWIIAILNSAIYIIVLSTGIIEQI